jgi:hypothetical protein
MQITQIAYLLIGVINLYDMKSLVHSVLVIGKKET